MNRPRGIDEKLCRASDINALRSCAGVQQIVTANDFRLRIGKKCVSETLLLPVAAIGFRRVNAERDYANAARFELRKPGLETPQLGVA